MSGLIPSPEEQVRIAEAVTAATAEKDIVIEDLRVQIAVLEKRLASASEDCTERARAAVEATIRDLEIDLSRARKGREDLAVRLAKATGQEKTEAYREGFRDGRKQAFKWVSGLARAIGLGAGSAIDFILGSLAPQDMGDKAGPGFPENDIPF